MNELSENQREKTGDARREGLLAEGIVECLQLAPNGIGTRQEALNYLQDIVGLTDDERSAQHRTNTGLQNYYASSIDWAADYLRKKKIMETTEETAEEGTWVLVDLEISSQEVRKSAKSDERKLLLRLVEERKKLRIEISDFCRTLNKEKKATLLKTHDVITKITDYIIETGSETEEAIDLFVQG